MCMDKICVILYGVDCICEASITQVKSTGLEGAVSIFFTCNCCFLQHAHFESSVQYESMSEVSVAVQVAFMVAGCTHAYYYRALKQALGIDMILTITPPTMPISMEIQGKQSTGLDV